MKAKLTVVAVVLVTMIFTSISVPLFTSNEALAGGVPRAKDARRVHSFFAESRGNIDVVIIESTPGELGFVITDVAVSSHENQDESWVFAIDDSIAGRIARLTTQDSDTNGSRPYSYHFESGLRLAPGSQVSINPTREGDGAYFVTICGYEVN